MRGSVPHGCRLLINGASLLLEEGETNDDQLLWGSSPHAAASAAAAGSGGDGGVGGGGGGYLGAGAPGGVRQQRRTPSWTDGGGPWGLAGGSLVCELSWMRLRALVDSLDLVCGIYVQVSERRHAPIQDCLGFRVGAPVDSLDLVGERLCEIRAVRTLELLVIFWVFGYPMVHPSIF